MLIKKDDNLGVVTVLPMFGGKKDKIKKGHVLVAVTEESGKMVTGAVATKDLTFKVSKDDLVRLGYSKGGDSIVEELKSKLKNHNITVLTLG